MSTRQTEERLRRWRLVLGAQPGEPGGGTGWTPTGRDAGLDRALGALYDPAPEGARRSAGLGASAPRLARWLGDIREYFPTGVVQLMQQDAIDRLGLERLLLEPEVLAAVEPDVPLVAALLALRHALPETTRESARQVVAAVLAELSARLAERTRSVLGGALDRGARTERPRPGDIDWDRTVRANLRHWVPERRTVVPERLLGRARARQGVRREVVLCVDQSASMAASLVHAALFGAVLASLPALATRLLVFDTAVADLTDRLDDPVELLFAAQLGGGTDIGRALAYCEQRIANPADTVLVLVSDLFEGGPREALLRRAAALTAAGVQLVVLLALSDEGAPAYDRTTAAELAALGVPAFACPPDAFPELMAAALERRELPVPVAAPPGRTAG
ncbi:VWA domain-containing protein [Kitasatospora viridis]|uniref:VWA domain containing CoxE-like protein n=1 Tax=Kitasatospora viridis TaxID=281105 RepID=A0A561UJM2_9ACTN|nr:VWA domain-containing protein [Kitasatospora viridis]TWF99557.1 VWA domain containing CoxE-like protein [Kitasatospora viridis]